MLIECLLDPDGEQFQLKKIEVVASLPAATQSGEVPCLTIQGD